MWAGMPFGSTVAALAASWLLPHYGWTSVFLVGGIVPMVIGLLMMVLMPESLHYLVRTGNQQRLTKARAILAKIDRETPTTDAVELTLTSKTEEKKGGSIRQLFQVGHAKTTILMWVLFFLSFYLLWILFSWVPTLLRNSGSTPQQYSIGFAFIHLGSFIACLCIGTLMAKFDKLNVVKILFLCGFFAMAAFGYFSGQSFAILLPICIITGMVVNGGNSSLMGVVTVAYPSQIRATGIGWAYGIGKLGTLMAPAVGGLFLEAHWSVLKICTVNGITALVIAGLVVLLQRHMRVLHEGEGW
jgi:AAHS family 4-hydroxybenzoate transporter-like MFS transporter